MLKYIRPYKNNDIALVDVALHKSEEDGYYLDLKYEVESSNDVREIHIPKVLLPINSHGICFVNSYDSDDIFSTNINGTFLYDSSTNMQLRIKSVKGVDYEERLVYTKTKKMTLQEIEEKLGHKVELVSEK